MGKLRTGHIVEAAIWLTIVIILYIYSFDFDREIEIYKFGASAWPRSILLLIGIAALGQLYSHWKNGDGSASTIIGQATDDGSGDNAAEVDHNSLRWYLWTALLMAIPFVYINLPEAIASAMELDKAGLGTTKLICAAILIAIYVFAIRGNHVGGILALPILFGAFLQDFGFYAMAPIFILGVMYLMGERRFKKMSWVMLIVLGILLMLFVSILYVGLPTGYISPFYEFGTTIVNILQ